MSKCLKCPECGLIWDDDPKVNDASHCDCGYRIDSIFPSFPGLHDYVEYRQPGNNYTTDSHSEPTGQRYSIKHGPRP